MSTSGLTPNAEFDRIAAAWLADGPNELADRVFDAALREVHVTHQRRRFAGPWRTASMSLFGSPVGRLAAVAIVAVVAVGGALYILRPGPGTGGPGASPTSSPSPAPTSQPSQPSSSGPTPTSVAFASDRHGLSLTVPAGWTITAATASWPIGVEGASPPDPMLDTFTGPGTQVFVAVSQPVPNGTTDAAWLEAYETAGAAVAPAHCWPPASAMEKVAVSGTDAWIHGGLAGCEFTEAIVFAGGRVYELSAYGVPSFGGTVFDRAIFDAFLASVTLNPAAAIDAPAAT